MRKWLRKHTFLVQTTAFLLMVGSSIPLFFAAKAGSFPAIAVMIILFVLGNILALLAP
jgi:hypothetical protein